LFKCYFTGREIEVWNNSDFGISFDALFEPNYFTNCASIAKRLDPNRTLFKMMLLLGGNIIYVSRLVLFLYIIRVTSYIPSIFSFVLMLRMITYMFPSLEGSGTFGVFLALSLLIMYVLSRIF
jgi:hypothetical protein